MSPAENLFDNKFLQRLETLSLVTRKNVIGRQAGERRSARRGNSVEFADYRTYTTGDDFRKIDWNAYARLEKLFIKLYMEEQETTIHILIDASASMNWGEPNKFRLARQLAGAMGYLGLINFDRVAVGLCGPTLGSFLGPVRGRSAVWRLWEFLGGVESGGATDLNTSLRGLANRRPAPGVAIVISDFLSPSGYREGVSFLQNLRQEVTLIQVLSPDELDPTLDGDLRLIDVETGGIQEVSVTSSLLDEYRRRLAAFTADLEQFSRARAMNFLQVPSNVPLEDLVLRTLRRTGLVK